MSNSNNNQHASSARLENGLKRRPPSYNQNSRSSEINSKSEPEVFSLAHVDRRPPSTPSLPHRFDRLDLYSSSHSHRHHPSASLKSIRAEKQTSCPSPTPKVAPAGDVNSALKAAVVKRHHLSSQSHSHSHSLGLHSPFYTQPMVPPIDRHHQGQESSKSVSTSNSTQATPHDSHSRACHTAAVRSPSSLSSSKTPKIAFKPSGAPIEASLKHVDRSIKRSTDFSATPHSHSSAKKSVVVKPSGNPVGVPVAHLEKIPDSKDTALSSKSHPGKSKPEKDTSPDFQPNHRHPPSLPPRHQHSPPKPPSHSTQKSHYKTEHDISMAQSQTNYEILAPSARAQQETWAQTQLRQISLCPGGWGWRRVKNGYHCSTGVHWITDALLAEGRGGLYIVDYGSKMGKKGPFYGDNEEDLGALGFYLRREMRRRGRLEGKARERLLEETEEWEREWRKDEGVRRGMMGKLGR